MPVAQLPGHDPPGLAVVVPNKILCTRQCYEKLFDGSGFLLYHPYSAQQEPVFILSALTGPTDRIFSELLLRQSCKRLPRHHRIDLSLSIASTCAEGGTFTMRTSCGRIFSRVSKR